MKRMNVVMTLAIALALTGCDLGMGPDPFVDPIYYTVSFDVDGTITTQKVESGQKATKPTDPTNAPHNFLGWYNGSTKYDFTTPVTSNVTLAAKWTTTKTMDIVRYDSSATWGNTNIITFVGYITLNLNLGTFENHWVSQTINGTKTDKNVVFASGTFVQTATEIALTITDSTDSTAKGKTTVYSINGSDWTWTGDPTMKGFGNTNTKTTTTSRSVVSHDIEVE